MFTPRPDGGQSKKDSARVLETGDPHHLIPPFHHHCSPSSRLNRRSIGRRSLKEVADQSCERFVRASAEGVQARFQGCEGTTSRHPLQLCEKDNAMKR